MAQARPTSGPMIETHDLRRTFKSRKTEVEAVRGVDLSVGTGEIFGFLGPNGAGKTTTLRMLATLLTPTSGEATIAGADLGREPQTVRERIGYVPQGGSTDPAETGRGELVIQGRLYGMNKADAQKRAAEVLATLDLEEAADRSIGTYSGGMKRRLDVGLGIVHTPAVLFLDEPTTGLDPQARARMWDEIRRLREQGTTVFLTTHYLEEADALADRLAIIDHGEIVAEGTPPTSSSGRWPATSSRSASTARWSASSRRSGSSRSCARRPARTGSSGSTWSVARRPSRRSCGCSTGPASRRPRSPSTVRVSTTSSSARPAARSATKPPPD